LVIYYRAVGASILFLSRAVEKGIVRELRSAVIRASDAFDIKRVTHALSLGRNFAGLIDFNYYRTDDCRLR
jgi:hypothetical protein